MAHRARAWNLRPAYLRAQGNPMEDPFRGHRPKRGRRVRPSDRVEFEPVDVEEIRERFDLPQTRFARMLGISVETLRNWERGRRRPLGPSRALLRIAAAHPDVVASVLSRARVRWSAEEEGSWEPLELVLKRHRARRARRQADRAEAEAEALAAEAVAAEALEAVRAERGEADGAERDEADEAERGEADGAERGEAGSVATGGSVPDEDKSDQ